MVYDGAPRKTRHRLSGKRVAVSRSGNLMVDAGVLKRERYGRQNAGEVRYVDEKENTHRPEPDKTRKALREGAPDAAQETHEEQEDEERRDAASDEHDRSHRPREDRQHENQVRIERKEEKNHLEREPFTVFT